MTTIRYQSHRISSVSSRLKGRLIASCLQHSQVLEAIREGNADLAAKRMEHHVRSVWDDLNSEEGLRVLREYGIVGRKS